MAKVSISIKDEDLRWLRVRAERKYGGNLSAAVADGIRLIAKNEALGALLDEWGVPELSPEEQAEIDAELDGKTAPRPKTRTKTETKPKTRRRRRAA